MGIENATKIIITTPITEVGFWAQIASILLVAILIWQVILLHKQIKISNNTTKLAHWPSIVSRIGSIGQVPVLQLENIGTGSAREVHLRVTNADNENQLEVIDMFAFKPNEVRQTVIDLTKTPRVRIKGTYENIIHDVEKVNVDFDYNERRAQEV